MIIGYGLKGSLAIYLPGGIDANTYPHQGLYTLFMINDSAAVSRLVGGYGAAAGVRLAGAPGTPRRALGRRDQRARGPGRIRWLALTGLADFAGIVGPVWLIHRLGRPAPRRAWAGTG